MFERLTERERGQVGIGTLIVFIALVLVAAIAAGVLINTAGFLQTQAEQTGEQSSQQVTDRLEPVEITGNVNENANEINQVEFLLQKSPGAGDINLSKATFTLTAPNGTYRFEVSNSTVFTNTETYQDNDGSLQGSGLILNDEADRLELTLDLTAATGSNYEFNNGRLEPGEELQIEITGESGATSVIRISVPTSLAGESSVPL